MSAPFVAVWMTIRRIQQEELERANNLSTTTNTSNPKPSPAKPAKAPISVLVALSIGFLVIGCILVIVGTIFTLPTVLALAGFDGLAAITFAVLSLREKN